MITVRVHYEAIFTLTFKHAQVELMLDVEQRETTESDAKQPFREVVYVTS